MPFVDGVRSIEIRERKNGEELAGATKNQLPLTALVTVNWTVDAAAGMELYKKYGTLDQFENRILDSKLRQAAKAALAEFNADELIRNRNAAIGRIQENLITLMEPYPVTVNSPQIENISLPDTYMKAVLEKERAREAAVREEYNLQKQRLEAQREVQSAEAARDSEKLRADGVAYRTRTVAEADAAAILVKGRANAESVKLMQQAIEQNPLVVQYEQARRWDGKMPTTVMGGDKMPMVPILFQNAARK